jgi:hypothetical protein
MARDVQTVIQELQLRKRQIEAQYLRTKEFLKSSEWHVKRDEVLMRLAKTLASYDPTLRQGQDPTTAVFVLGQAKQIMLEIQEISDVIVEYESIEQRLERHYATERIGA